MYFNRLTTNFRAIACGGHDHLWGIVDNVHRSIKYALPDPEGDFMWYNAPEFPTTDATSIDVGTDGTVNVLTDSGDLYYFECSPFDNPKDGYESGSWAKVATGMVGNVSVQQASVRAGIKTISIGIWAHYNGAVELARDGEYLLDSGAGINVSAVAISPRQWVIASNSKGHLHLHDYKQQVTIGIEGSYSNLCFASTNLILAVHDNELMRYLWEGTWETIKPMQRSRDKSGKWVYSDVGPIVTAVSASSPNRIFLCTCQFSPSRGFYDYRSYLSIPGTQGKSHDATQLITDQTYMDDQSNEPELHRRALVAV